MKDWLLLPLLSPEICRPCKDPNMDSNIDFKGRVKEKLVMCVCGVGGRWGMDIFGAFGRKWHVTVTLSGGVRGAKAVKWKSTHR